MLEVFLTYLITGCYLVYCGYRKDKLDGYADQWKEEWWFIPTSIIFWPFIVWFVANSKDF